MKRWRSSGCIVAGGVSFARKATIVGFRQLVMVGWDSSTKNSSESTSVDKRWEGRRVAIGAAVVVGDNWCYSLEKGKARRRRRVLLIMASPAVAMVVSPMRGMTVMVEFREIKGERDGCFADLERKRVNF